MDGNDEDQETAREVSRPWRKDLDAGKIDEYEAFNRIRRIADTDKPRLFRRAEPDDEYVKLLSEAGVLKAKGQRETKCIAIPRDGDWIALCNHRSGMPARLDCREPSCPYAILMRMRVDRTLRQAYALERKKHVGQ